MFNQTEFMQLFEKSMGLTSTSKVHPHRENKMKMLYYKLLNRLAHGFEVPFKIRTKTFWNESMTVVIPELVSLDICLYGYYEAGLTRMILEHLKTGMTFFDVGAHFGYFTLLGSAVVGNSGQMHSFEPSPTAFNILKENVMHKDNVFLNRCAVSDKKKTVCINDYGIKYSAFNSVYDARLPRDVSGNLKVKKYEVDTVSVDGYVESTKVIPDFIKIDAESSEYEILRGCARTIAAYHPKITLEVGDFKVAGVSPSSVLINFLVDAGYNPCEYKNGRILPHVLKTTEYPYDNMLFVHKDELK